MALPLRRNAHFEKMNSEGALGKPWASFLRHLPRETLISRKERAATSQGPTQYQRSCTALRGVGTTLRRGGGGGYQ